MLEESDAEAFQHYFPERDFVPLLEVLATVNRHTGWRCRAARSRGRTLVGRSRLRSPLLPRSAHRILCGFNAVGSLERQTRASQAYLGKQADKSSLNLRKLF
jgi:hypothetical protein